MRLVDTLGTFQGIKSLEGPFNALLFFCVFSETRRTETVMTLKIALLVKEGGNGDRMELSAELPTDIHINSGAEQTSPPTGRVNGSHLERH